MYGQHLKNFLQTEFVCAEFAQRKPDCFRPSDYGCKYRRNKKKKYYALYFTDFQQWFEYRRTGFPVMPVADGMLNNKIMPVRYRYPPAVQSTNTENYNQAVQAMGGDNINIKVWWEK